MNRYGTQNVAGYAKEMQANPNTPKNRAAAAIGQRNLKTFFGAGVKITCGN